MKTCREYQRNSDDVGVPLVFTICWKARLADIGFCSERYKHMPEKYSVLNIIFYQPFSCPDIEEQSKYKDFYRYKNFESTCNMF
jgi:hypothetical protein